MCEFKWHGFELRNKFFMHRIANHVLKDKLSLNHKSLVQHYLLVCVIAFTWHGGQGHQIEPRHRFKTKLQFKRLKSPRGDHGVRKLSQMMMHMSM